MGFEVVGGGTPTAEEVAAIAAALEVTRRAKLAESEPPAGRWRWSGRRWNTERGTRPNWRTAPLLSHPSRP